MAGLLELNDGQAPSPQLTVLLDRDAGNLVDVVLPGGYALYQLNPGDGWSLFGPQDHSGGPPALAPGPAILDDQSFTPLSAGRYLVKLKVHDLATGIIPSEFTAVFEVGSAYNTSGAIPAPQERDESLPLEGWSRSYEGHLSNLQKVLSGRNVVRAKNAGGVLAYGQTVKVRNFLRHKTVGAGGDDMSLHLKGIVLEVVGLTAANVAIVTDSLLIALEPVAAGAIGNFLLYGMVPLDTVAFGAEGDPVYIQDTGLLGSAPGTNTRLCGYVVKKAASTMATAEAGLVVFNGDPTQGTTESGTLSYERALAGFGLTELVEYQLAGGDGLDASTVGPGNVVATLEIVAYVTVDGQDGEIQLFNKTDNEIVHTETITAIQPAYHTQALVIGGAAGNLRNDGLKVYELRIRRVPPFVDALEQVIIMKASLQFKVTI